MKTRILIVAFCLLSFTTLLNAADRPASSQLKAFPAAEKGMVRHVIYVPHKTRAEEGAYKVELIAGRMVETDGTNLYMLGKNILPKPLKGWGYTFYKVTGSATGPVASTMMAPNPNAKKKKRFVSGAPFMIRYNSRLPIVVYAPTGFDIKYRIFTAPAEFTPADKL